MLSNFKSIMEYQNVDFTACKVKMYESVRAALTGIYHDSTFFWPSSTDAISISRKKQRIARWKQNTKTRRIGNTTEKWEGTK